VSRRCLFNIDRQSWGERQCQNHCVCVWSGCYGLFFAAFLYLIGFLANQVVPKGVDEWVSVSMGSL